MTSWGVIGIGRIGQNFIKNLLEVPTAKLYAVASKSALALDRFSQHHPDILTYDSYEKIIEDPQIDALYIALISDSHYQYAKMALEKHIPVICIVPSVKNVKEFDEMIEISQKNKTLYLEGIRTRFMPCYHQLKQDALSIGKIQEIHCNVNEKQLDDNYWLYYSIAFAMGIIDSTLIDVDLFNDDEVEVIELLFRNQCKLVIDRSSLSYSSCKIVGANGTIILSDYTSPQEYTIFINDVSKERRFDIKNDLVPVIEAVELCRNKGLLEHPDMTIDQTRQIIDIADNIRREMKYE